ncbi:protein-tyrosine-phosphatase [Formosa sp. S-31]|uniref:protein-tyrosine-phosphatase n=1 Tax=Formosa sp. S-31 TaxID=2790949 RepID=UPI003EBE79CA
MIKMKTQLFEAVDKLISNLDTNSISETRKETLQPLIDFIQEKHANGETIRLNFICTHNSRRSHLSQIWAQTLAEYYNIKNVDSYSGGTEATALFPKVAETLINQGFKIQKLSESKNPVYAVKFASNDHSVICFSKRLDDDFNPKSDFAAIMTCDSANEACPVVSGAACRIPVTFEDPKAFDGTPQQAEKYAERSLQIATELKYVFSNIK